MQPESDPDTGWVAHLARCPPTRAAEAIEEAARDRRLFGQIDRAHHAEGRSSYIEIDAPLELYALVRCLKPRHVVEVGVSSGVSSAYILRALERNRRGTLHSVDRPQPERRSSEGTRRTNPSWSIPLGRSSGWAVPGPLWTRWDLRIGDKRDVIPFLVDQLDDLGLFVYDVPHDDDDARSEFRLLDQLLRIGSVAIADHGPHGDLCSALAWWARRRGSRPVRRSGLGLFAFRCQE